MDAVMQALEARAKGDAAPVDDDPVSAALSERAAGKKFAVPVKAIQRESSLVGLVGRDEMPAESAQKAGELAVGVAENVIPALQSVYAEPAAWLAKQGAIAGNQFGLTDGSPEGVQNAVRRFLMSSPQTPMGQTIEGGMGSVLRPMAESAQFYGNQLDRIPAVGPGLRNAAEGVLALAPGAAMVREARAPLAAVERGDLTAPPPVAKVAGKTGFERESMGAAAAAQNLDNVSPAIREAIQEVAQTGGLNRQVLTRHLEADTLPIPVRLTKGQATQDPMQLSLEQNSRGKNPEFARQFNEQNTQLIENMDEIRRNVSPQVVHSDHIQNGQALIDAYKAADEPVRAQITDLYKQLEAANGGQFPVDGAAFVAAADAALSKKMKGRYVPSQVAGDLEDLRSGGPMTFENFENLRTNLAAEARKADRSGDGNAAAAVNIVREALESLPMTGEAANIKPLADAARAAAKARFDRLRADPAYRAAVDDSVAMGEHSPLADDFVNKYVVKGKGANIKQMRENLADDPVAVETIAAGALNYLKSKSGVNLFTNEGNFSQAGYNRALAELTPRLPDLVPPEVADQLQALGNVARYTQAQPRGSFVNNSNTFVAAAADKAKGLIEAAGNTAVPGLGAGSYVRKKIDQRTERKFVEESLRPAAGLKANPKDKP